MFTRYGKRELERVKFFKVAGIVIFMLIFLISCERSFHLGIKYPHTVAGLEEGDRVLIENKKVGKVSKIVKLPGKEFLVDISIAQELKGRLTDKSGFYLIEDPDIKGRKAIEIRVEEGGNPLEEGSVVEGRIAGFSVEQFLDNLEQGFDELSNQLKGLAESIQKIPQSQEYQKLKKELEQLAEEIKNAGQEAKDKLHNEVIPKLQKELEELKKELRKFGKEKEVEPLEEELDNLKRI